MKTIRLTDNLSILTKEDGYVDFATIGNDWFELSDDEESCITVHWSELANIPHVKALIEALKHTEFGDTYEPESECSYCPWCKSADWKGHEKDCKVGNALAPFKKSAGDK